MKRITALALALAFAPLSAIAQDATGLWQSAPSEETGAYITVQIGACQGAPEERCGVIRGVFNADGTPGAQDIVGEPIIWGMEPDGAGAWSGGTIWAPDQDKTYNSKMELSGSDLEVSGCVLFICRAQTWTRVN